MKQVNKEEFRWLQEYIFPKRHSTCWTITSKQKKSKRHKFYVEDRDAELVRKHFQQKYIKKG